MDVTSGSEEGDVDPASTRRQEPPVLPTLERPGASAEPPADDADVPAASAPPWLVRHARLLLTSTVGLLVGIGVTYVALRPEPVPSVFSGPPSVQAVDRPAPVSGESGIRLPGAFRPTAPSAEPASARAALVAFLDAEVADRSGSAEARSIDSFSLLDPVTQERHGSVAAWRSTRAERAVPEGYAVTAERRVDAGVELTVAASRTPSITPFRGLVAAKTTERWFVSRTAAGGWRVRDGRAASTTPEIPPDAAAVAAAKRWTDGAARCDRSIVDLQVEPSLLGSPQLSQVACDAKGTWSTVDIRPVDELGAITPFVAAYGSGVGRWGRGVDVASGDERFTVVLGPVGNEWRVMGLLAPAGGR